MSLPLFLRRPLPWLLLAETVVVSALSLAAWHVWSTHRGSVPAVATVPSRLAPASPRGRPPGPPASPAPQPSARAAPGAGPATGLSTDPEFLARQMNELNRVESTFENLEWRATRAIVDAIQYYVERVVLPSIDRTEKAAR